MLDSENFIDDMVYLADYYGWGTEDIEDVMSQTVANPDEMSQYWTWLAAAHRAGYEQTSENNYLRLEAWCDQQGARLFHPCALKFNAE